MKHFVTASAAACLLATPTPSNALIYINSIKVDDVTLNLRIETNGKLGLIDASDIIAFDASVVDAVGQTFTYRTTSNFEYTLTYGPFRASTFSFDLNEGYLAMEQEQIDDRVMTALGVGGAAYDPGSDRYYDGEYYLAWGRPGYQDGRIVRVPYSEFQQSIAFAPKPAAVPEPATWAMFIGGFGLLGAAMRRRQRVVVSFV